MPNLTSAEYPFTLISGRVVYHFHTRTKTEDRCTRRGFALGFALKQPVPTAMAAGAARARLRHLLWHRQKLVWMHNTIGNQLHVLAMGEGLCRKKQLFTRKGLCELEALRLDKWASRQRHVNAFPTQNADVCRRLPVC